ncbi:unnamed protein product [Prunus armeniaca]
MPHQGGNIIVLMAVINNLTTRQHCWKLWRGAGSYVECAQARRSWRQHCWKLWRGAGSYVGCAQTMRSWRQRCGKLRRGASSCIRCPKGKGRKRILRPL